LAVEPIPGLPEHYELLALIGTGATAAVYLARDQQAPPGSQIVAIKRLHPSLSEDVDIARMFDDEARMASRIDHPNVVRTIDVVRVGRERFHVMQYVHGGSLAQLAPVGRPDTPPPPPPVAYAMVVGVLRGLHASHEALAEDGQPLRLVHRDISPENLLIDEDGIARVTDFGIAKAIGRARITRNGNVRGKVPYLAPELLLGGEASRASDVYATAVVLWELLSGREFVPTAGHWAMVQRVLAGAHVAVTTIRPEIPARVNAVLTRALDYAPVERFPSAEAFADALEANGQPASTAEVSAWVHERAGLRLVARTEAVEAQQPAMGDRLELNVDGPHFQLWRAGRSTLRMSWRAGVVRWEVSGHGVPQLIPPMLHLLEAVLAAGWRLTIFIDFGRMPSYDSRFRVGLTEWGISHRKELESAHLLSQSQLVTMGAHLANLALAGIITIHRQRTTFEQLAAEHGVAARHGE
jgi:serine/threonine-protein kinase